MMRGTFTNEPSLDFSLDENRAAMRAALASVGGELGRRYPLVIGGERRETGDWIRSVNPGNLDQLVGEVARARPADAEDAIAAAEQAYGSWRRMPVEGRAGVLFRMAAIVRRRRLELAAWMVYELDKAWDEAEGEVAEAVDFLEWYARQAFKLAEPAELAHLPNEANDYRYFPIGVGVVIPPWNFPCAILAGMTMAPVVVGNTVVLKPASNTPSSATRWSRLWRRPACRLASSITCRAAAARLATCWWITRGSASSPSRDRRRSASGSTSARRRSSRGSAG
jgi:1-pyrroline-5-carboxylate dehydrogenase